MDPNQQQLLLTAGGKKSTYIEDVYSTQVWVGNDTAGRSIDVGIDMAGEGGMTWIKRRNANEVHCINDTVRGAGKYLQSNGTAGETNDTNRLTSFTDTGFTVGTDTCTNSSSNPYVAWNFRKAEGFFDVVTYTGNDTGGTQIAHNLGTVPGCVIIKRYNGTEDWAVWHRGAADAAPGNTMTLNQVVGASDNAIYFWDTAPTATHFTVGISNRVNVSGEEYVAYIFAGGEVGYNSVKFDGVDDYLRVAASGDFTFGTGDFTAEAWFNRSKAGNHTIMCLGDAQTSDSFEVYLNTNGGVNLYVDGESRVNTGSPQYGLNEWCHIAIVRSGNNITLYLDGTAIGSPYSYTGNIGSASHHFYIGKEFWNNNSSNYMNGYISNVRVVKGQALYTSNFTPTTVPLTLTSQSATANNVSTLCCNGDLVTSATTNNDPVVSYGSEVIGGISPFALPSALFGDGGDQAIVKCGKYVGNASATGPVINTGWQPQWVMLKKVTGSTTAADWYMLDSIRGVVSANDDKILEANDAGGESGNAWNLAKLTATGFQIEQGGDSVNQNGQTFLYMAIRDLDPLVGKPALAGTDVFAMDVGSGSSTIPPGVFDSGFPVDFALMREPAASSQWYTTTRLQGYGYVRTNDTTAEAQGNPSFYKGSKVGWGEDTYSTNWMAWMWKKWKGFDTVAYMGNGGTAGGRMINHNLGRIPEMIWIKNRNQGAYNWQVYHKDIGNTHYLQLNESVAKAANTNRWNNTTPTAEVFTVGSYDGLNQGSQPQIAMLFASVAGICKVGSYDGTDTTQTITTGFQPRFLIIKRESAAGNWIVLDTTRGWASGNDQRLKLESTDAQESGADVGDPTSTGFTLTGNQGDWNDAGSTYIYYAHA